MVYLAGRMLPNDPVKPGPEYARRRTGKRLVLAIALVAPMLAGCVERRMTVRTTPSNALVVLDGHEIGHSPVSVPFYYYGDREIKLIKDQYETKTVKQRIAAPWHQIPPFDFFSEVVWPFRIRDEREYAFTLEPTVMVPEDELLDRAENVRSRGQNIPSRTD